MGKSEPVIMDGALGRTTLVTPCRDLSRGAVVTRHGKGPSFATTFKTTICTMRTGFGFGRVGEDLTITSLGQSLDMWTTIGIRLVYQTCGGLHGSMLAQVTMAWSKNISTLHTRTNISSLMQFKRGEYAFTPTARTIRTGASF